MTALIMAFCLLLSCLAGCSSQGGQTQTQPPAGSGAPASSVPERRDVDLSGMNEWRDRLIPSMQENCTDINSGKQYRVCTNMTMAGFFYKKEIFETLDLTPAETWEDFVSNLEAIKGAYERYFHIAQLIDGARASAGGAKPVILAAYLAPFQEGDRKQAMTSAQILTAAIVSHGGYHLLTGECKAVLAQGFSEETVMASIYAKGRDNAHPDAMDRRPQRRFFNGGALVEREPKLHAN